MFRLDSEQELLKAFRPKDRRHVEPPRGQSYPLYVPDYFAWTERAGFRVNVVFARPGSREPIGLAFQRDNQADKGLATRVCDWCHAYGSSMDIGMLGVDVTSKHHVAVLLCLDLRCKEKLETTANLAGRSTLELTHRVLERMHRFAQEALGLGGPQGSSGSSPD
jgi:hypothetical protein